MAREPRAEGDRNARIEVLAEKSFMRAWQWKTIADPFEAELSFAELSAHEYKVTRSGTGAG